MHLCQLERALHPRGHHHLRLWSDFLYATTVQYPRLIPPGFPMRVSARIDHTAQKLTTQTPNERLSTRVELWIPNSQF